MNSSELKYQYELNNPKGFFFTRPTMKVFGDTMRNYGVINHGSHYELWRKRPVKHGVTKSAFFSSDTFKLIHLDGSV
jgi:hypothetical protein